MTTREDAVARVEAIDFDNSEPRLTERKKTSDGVGIYTHFQYDLNDSVIANITINESIDDLSERRINIEVNNQFNGSGAIFAESEFSAEFLERLTIYAHSLPIVDELDNLGL